MAESTHGAHTTGSTGSARADHGGGEPHKAGAFDIRVFIGSLLGIYGVILVLTALFSSDGREINLITGICMLVAAGVFITWARLRPVVVPDHVEGEEAGRPAGH